MIDQYKYISKPYTLEELVSGNPIFKVYYDFFYNFYEWQQKQDLDVIDYTDRKHLELLFNEFLHAISLFLYDKITFNETLKALKSKTEEIVMFGFMLECLPFIIEEYPFLYEETLMDKTRDYFSISYNSESIIPISEEDNNSLSLVVSQFLNEIKKALTKEHIFDLTLFFDKPISNSLNEFFSEFSPNSKRIKNQNSMACDLFPTETQKGLDASQKVLLIEELIRSDKWGNATERKKAEIIALIIDRNSDNIRRVLTETNKPLSNTSQKFKDDLLKAQNIIKLLG